MGGNKSKESGENGPLWINTRSPNNGDVMFYHRVTEVLVFITFTYILKDSVNSKCFFCNASAA